MGDRTSIQQLVQQTIAKFGRLDVVVSNAGWTRVTNFSNLDEGMVDEDWDRCFLYNVKSHLWLMHAAKEALEQSEGAFVTTASVAGVKPSGSSLPYAVTKAAAIHLSKALAVICSPKIRVNSVSPRFAAHGMGLEVRRGENPGSDQRHEAEAPGYSRGTKSIPAPDTSVNFSRSLLTLVTCRTWRTRCESSPHRGR